MEEEICLRQSDYQELEEAKLESERRLKQELTQLQAELAQSTNIEDQENSSEAIHSLEEEVKTLTLRLQEAEQQNEGLNDEISRMVDEITQLSDEKSKIASSTKADVDKLKQEISEYQQQLQIYSSEINSLLMTVKESQDENDEKTKALIKLEEIIRTKDEAYDRLSDESMKRQSALEKQIQDLNAKLNARELKLEPVSNDKSIVTETVNPMSPHRAGSNIASPVGTKKKSKTTDLQLDTIYKTSPDQSPTLSTHKENPLSSRKSRGSTGSTINRKSLLFFESLPAVSPHSSDIIAIDEAIDKIDLEQLLLESSTSVREATRNALISQDLETVRKELLLQTKLYEMLKKSNAKLLQQVLATKNNIQVCCRTRPLLDSEFVDGGKICVEAIDDNEVVCYDRRAEIWRSFAFDKVWSATCKQVC